MFLLSEIYQSQAPYSVRFFKPWWDLLIDYLIMGILLVTLLTFTRVLFEADFGITSIGLNQTLSFWEAKYVSARCSHHFEGKYLVYYPYLLFFEWIIFSVIQNGWLVLPAITSKLENFYKIFNGMFKTQPKFYRKPNTLKMPNELKFEDENKEKIEILHNRLLYLLTSTSFLVRIYQVKTFILIVWSIFITFFILITPFKYLDGFKYDFPCDLPHIPDVAIGYSNILCHFQPSLFIYGAIIGNFVLCTTITIISFNGIIWIIKLTFLSGDHDIAETISDYYSGLPGFEDFRFCIMLVQLNIRDGNVMFETIKNCINSQAKKFQRYDYARRCKVDDSSLMEIPIKLEEDSKHFSLWIAEQLGFKEVENSQRCDHLFDYVQEIRDSLGVIDINVSLSMRDRILNEIEENPQVFKTIIENDNPKVSYDDYIIKLRNRNVYGKQYSIMAASELLNIRIVLIQCHPNKKVQEVFLPYRKDSTNIKTTKFITFISPYYYHGTVDLPLSSDWPSIAAKRRMYACDASFRASMRTAAIRCCDTDFTLYQGNRNTNNEYLRAKEENGATIEMPVMGLKRKL